MGEATAAAAVGKDAVSGCRGEEEEEAIGRLEVCGWFVVAFAADAPVALANGNGAAVIGTIEASLAADAIAAAFRGDGNAAAANWPEWAGDRGGVMLGDDKECRRSFTKIEATDDPARERAGEAVEGKRKGACWGDEPVGDTPAAGEPKPE